MFELLGLLGLGLPILLIVLVVVAIRQSGTISALQSRLQQLDSRVVRLEMSPTPRDEGVLDRLREQAAAAMSQPPVVETPAATVAPVAPAIDTTSPVEEPAAATQPPRTETPEP